MATVSIPIPTALIKPALDKLDALKAKFLSVPANVRAAKDRLARVRMAINKNGNVPADVNTAAQNIDNNLTRVNSEWNASAERFTQLDDLRRSGSLMTMDALTVATSLATSVGYVLSNADSSVRAVDQLADKYLSAEQKSTLDTATTGVAGVGLPTLALLGVGAYLLMRRR